jgi:hypothetical protein
MWGRARHSGCGSLRTCTDVRVLFIADMCLSVVIAYHNRCIHSRVDLLDPSEAMLEAAAARLQQVSGVTVGE